jgi:HTH-type transcriptional regulator/antitoxin HigA
MADRLKYTVISSRKQYDEYCDLLEELACDPEVETCQELQQEVELLTVLIDKWDREHSSFADSDPIQLLKYLMAEHGLKAKDLVDVMGVSKGMVSSVLNYRRGLSKESIRRLASHFKLSQEAFNRPYKLIAEVNKSYKNATMMNTRKDLQHAEPA